MRASVGLIPLPSSTTCNSVRPASRTEQRVAEAARLGFKRIVISGYAPKSQKKVEGIEVVRIHSVSELAANIFERQTYSED